MIKNSQLQAFLTYLLCVVVYFAILQIDQAFLSFYLDNKDVSFNEYDQIIYHQITGYIFASIFLLLFSKFFTARSLATLCLITYIISMLSICFDDINIQTNFLYFSLYSTSHIIIGYVIFIHLFDDKGLSSEGTVISICFSLLVALFINQIVNIIFIKNIAYITTYDLTQLIIANIVFVTISYIIIFSLSIFKKKINMDDHNFSGVIKNSELEIICGFSVFYIFRIIIDGYDNYFVLGQLPSLEDGNIDNYMILLIFLVVTSIMFNIKRFNLYLIKIFAIAISLCIFLTIPYWSIYKNGNFIGWAGLGIMFPIIVICNILVIRKKFDEANFTTGTELYMLGCTVGYYCGLITSENLEDTVGENGFLVSVSFVLFSLLAYYIYFFRKYRLWQWRN